MRLLFMGIRGTIYCESFAHSPFTVIHATLLAICVEYAAHHCFGLWVSLGPDRRRNPESSFTQLTFAAATFSGLS